MLYQHSFWYRASQREFNKALKVDPECGIAYWGIALSLLWNPHVAPPVKNLADGAAALAKGKRLAPNQNGRLTISSALSAMYTDYQTVDHHTRVLNYMKAMEQLAAKYPSDDEAQIDYAISLNVGASPMDKTYANQLKGAAIFENIWQRQPDHPGIPHYLIHLYDTPALAEKGIPAARRLRAKWRPTRRMPCICRRIFSRGSATGGIRSIRNRGLRACRPGGARKPPINCTQWIMRSMPICNSGKTLRRRR